MSRAPAAVLALALLALAAWARQDAPVDGEYGLWVRLPPDSLVVQWLTTAERPGVLEATWRGGGAQRFTTPAARLHRAAMVRPRADSVVLRYGTADAPPYRTTVVLTQPRRDAVVFGGPDSLYVMGDTHGEFDALVRTLRAAGFIDESLHWVGGRRHLAFAGDLVDRGRDATRLLWFVYRLEREAARAGGQVHVVLGNHEIMDMTGDLRYLHPREAALAAAHGVSYDKLFNITESLLGRWLASKPAVIQIGGVLIVHGGVTAEFSAFTLRQLDRILAGFMEPALFYRDPTTATSRADSLRLEARDNFFWHPRSLFWYRDYVQTDTVAAELDSVLHHFRADVMVVGHTPLPRIEARYEGRLIAANTVRFGADLLLLVREHGQYRRFRIDERGIPEPF